MVETVDMHSRDRASPGLLRSRCAVAMLALAAPIPANAQIVSPAVQSCHDAPVRPATVTAYFAALLTGEKPTVPSPELLSYQAVAKAAKATDWANLCRYRADNLRLAERPQAERRVVYMGDSITEAWAVADPDFFTGGRINRGISGQTTGQMLLRFQADVVALHPRAVHILAGVNDIAGNEGPETNEDIQNNLSAMVTLAKANRIRVVLASLTPANKFPWNPGVAPIPRIAAMNAWLKSYAARVGATWLDYHTPLAAADQGMRPELTFDGVHLNGAGYRLIKPLSTTATGGR